MKKIFALGLVLALFTATVSAQQTRNDFRNGREYHQRFDRGKMTKGEKAKLHKNDRKYKHAKKRFMRDGKLSPMERKQLAKMKRHDRRDTYRFRHNSRRS